MSVPITPEREHLRRRAFNMSCEDMFWLASMVAENVGYVLVPEKTMHEIPTLEERVNLIEAAVKELNPGWAGT